MSKSRQLFSKDNSEIIAWTCFINYFCWLKTVICAYSFRLASSGPSGRRLNEFQLGSCLSNFYSGAQIAIIFIDEKNTLKRLIKFGTVSVQAELMGSKGRPV